ncbi:MAG: ORF6N domain-containing protein [Candidatus Marinimicrobia bacterium]|nr:ORF6N domain-containing protein [Candidatus Neomarinimicrobiota bacterium]
MRSKSIITEPVKIQNLIYTIQGEQVMLDRDLADLYDVTTGNLNKAVKRNIDRFPDDFMFQLTKEELQNLIFQNGTSSWGGTRKLPFVFTEQGVASLSGVLKSKRAIEINIQIMRAFVTMRKFIGTNAKLFQRIDRVELKQLEHDHKFDKVFDAIEQKGITPKQGIIYEGQIYDAHAFVSKIIQSAKKSIIIIDNYIDDSVLTLLTKRKKGVQIKIYTKSISKRLALDIEKFNEQYGKLVGEEQKNIHDRFIIIDGKEIYHSGASLKDLGKKISAFSRFEKDGLKLLGKLT